jgi:hypothetical protein
MDKRIHCIEYFTSQPQPPIYMNICVSNSSPQHYTPIQPSKQKHELSSMTIHQPSVTPFDEERTYQDNQRTYDHEPTVTSLDAGIVTHNHQLKTT